MSETFITNKDEKKVSIIIPAYNVSKYLKKQLSCIRNQTYKNIEILFVNDGSLDNTFELAQKLATVEPRLKVFTKQNEGAGSARNYALQRAQGEFIWFYDIDDEVELDLIAKNVRWMSEYNTDMNMFSFMINDHGAKQKFKSLFPQRLIENNDDLKSIFVDQFLLIPNGNGFLWNKFYRKSFFDKHNIRFENQRIQQDEVFNMKCYPILERIYISEDLLYHYELLPNGNTASKYIHNKEHILFDVYDQFNFLFLRWNLLDSRIPIFLERRLIMGLKNVIQYNLFLPTCSLSYGKRYQIMKDILKRVDKMKIFETLFNYNSFRIDDFIILKTMQLNNVTLLLCISWCFNKIYKVIYTFKK